MKELNMLIWMGIGPVLAGLFILFVFKQTVIFQRLKGGNDEGDDSGGGLPNFPILPNTPFGQLLIDRQEEGEVRKLKKNHAAAL